MFRKKVTVEDITKKLNDIETKRQLLKDAIAQSDLDAETKIAALADVDSAYRSDLHAIIRPPAH